MGTDPFYKQHWKAIDPDRLNAYREGFGWDDLTRRLFEPAEISAGQTVGDFGCGPGKISVELAQQVGPSGHVHALDINSDFLEMTRENGTAAGIAEQITTHLSDGDRLPLNDMSLDRICARNAIMYVDDPVATLKEFHRVLRPDGIAHAIDGDWFMMVAEPIDHDEWRAFVKAAAHACRYADMGRKLCGMFKAAGFKSVDVQIVAQPDTQGRLLGMIRNMGKYAIESASIEPERVAAVVQQAEEALSDGSYFVVSPQFVVTGRKQR